MRKKSDKQRAREAEIARIYARDGCVRPSTLFEESALIDAPFHDIFEWDREKCFMEHNLAIARRTLRVVMVPYNDGTFSKLANVPQTVETTIIEKRDDRDLEGKYIPMRTLVQNDGHDLKASLTGLLRRLHGVEKELSEFYGEAYGCGRHDFASDFDHALNGVQVAIRRVEPHTTDDLPADRTETARQTMRVVQVPTEH